MTPKTPPPTPAQHTSPARHIRFALLALAAAFGVIGFSMRNLHPALVIHGLYGMSLALTLFSLQITTVQRNKALARALTAEAELRQREQLLKKGLNDTSSDLRSAHHKELHHLHTFALIGQSTAAMLHEISNHLSVLSLDIGDIPQYRKNTHIIANVKNGIAQLDRLVCQARDRLAHFDAREIFDVTPAIEQGLGDIKRRHPNSRTAITADISIPDQTPITGNPSALVHIITILLDNAIEACEPLPHMHITAKAYVKAAQLILEVRDTGPGIPREQQATLFHPAKSSKQYGLGIGLFLARNLAEDQLGGTLEYKSGKQGAHFRLTIPYDASSSGHGLPLPVSIRGHTSQEVTKRARVSANNFMAND